jgi:hypothetical protein
MVALAKDVKIQGLSQVPDGLADARISPLGEEITALNSQIKNINASLEKVSDTYLVKTQYCNGESHVVEVTKLYSSYETKYQEEIIEQLVQAKRVLESMDVKARISVFNPENKEELRIETEHSAEKHKAPEKEALEIQVKNGESVFQKLTEVMYGKESESFVVQSLEQLEEIVKFAAKFGIEILTPAPKIEHAENISIYQGRAIAHEIDFEIPREAALPSAPIYRSEGQVLVLNPNEIPQTPIAQSPQAQPAPRKEKQAPRDWFLQEKIKISILKDLDDAKQRKEEPRRSLLAISNYVLAA